MPEKKRVIKVVYSYSFALTRRFGVFPDWYDFADWVKQENLQGRSVTITHWEYADA